jgi:hypothetical protein
MYFFLHLCYFPNKSHSFEGSGKKRTKPFEWLSKKDLAGMCISGDRALGVGFVVGFEATVVVAGQP